MFQYLECFYQVPVDSRHIDSFLPCYVQIGQLLVESESEDAPLLWRQRLFGIVHHLVDQILFCFHRSEAWCGEGEMTLQLLLHLQQPDLVEA